MENFKEPTNQENSWQWKRLQKLRKDLQVEKETRTGKEINKKDFLNSSNVDHSDLEKILKERQLKRMKTVANTPGFRSRKK